MSLADDFLNSVTGTVIDYDGIFLPAGFLWANGAAVSRSTYARLFNALTLSTTGTTTSGNATVSAVGYDLTTLDCSPIGWPISGPGIQSGTTISGFTSTTITLSQNATASASGVALVLAPHGVGDGSTTFNVPDRRGRGSAGRDNMGGTAASRLTSGGSGVVGSCLGAVGGAETHTLTASQLPAHNHPISVGGASNGSGANSNYWQGANAVGAGALTGNNTGGASHNNTQPTFITNKIIKT